MEDFYGTYSDNADKFKFVIGDKFFIVGLLDIFLKADLSEFDKYMDKLSKKGVIKRNHR